MANQLTADASRELKPKEPSPEEVWIREFVWFYGTENLTRIFRDRLSGVSVTRALEALTIGTVVSVSKEDGPGCICRVRHRSDDNLVEVEVFFEANIMELEIREANIIEESESEPNAA